MGMGDDDGGVKFTLEKKKLAAVWWIYYREGIVAENKS